MPTPTISLQYILLGYVSIATIVIAIFAYIIDRLKTKNSVISNNNIEYVARIKQLQDNLTRIHNQNESSHAISEAQTILDQIDFGMIVLSPSLTILSVNPYAERLFGIQNNKVITQKFSDIIHLVDENNHIIESPVTDALRGKSSYLPLWTFTVVQGDTIPLIGEFTPLVGTGDGHQIVFHFYNAKENFSRSWDMNQKIQELAKIVSDQTTDLLSIRQSHEIGGYVFNRLSIGMILIDTNGIITGVNPYAEVVLGINAADCIGHSYSEMIPLKNISDEPDYTNIEAALKGHDSYFRSWTFLNTHQMKRAISGGVIPLAESNTPSSILMYFEDRSQQYSDETEGKAFFSSVAHDLRAPLTTVRAVLELLESSSATLQKDQLVELSKGAKDSIIHLINLVNDLLNVSRIDQNRIALDKTVFDITKLTHTLIDGMQTQAKEKRLTLTYETEETNIPKVIGDQNKTIDIITNLLSNAIKYTQIGGVKVKQMYEDGHISTYISDTGIGIADSDKNLLFKKYQQMWTSRKFSSAKSTGLGLYIAKKFAVIMGGNITLVSSEPEKGSVFKFDLPIAPSSQASDLTSQS